MTEPTFDPCCNCGRDTFIRRGELFCDRPSCRTGQETAATTPDEASTKAAEALEALSDSLNRDNLVEECWSIRGMADALVGHSEPTMDADHLYSADYWRGFRAVQAALSSS